MTWRAPHHWNGALRRRLEEDDESYSWSDENVKIACGVSIGAGLATGIGGLIVFAPALLERVPKDALLACALALSGGVMLYVSFIEIFVKSEEAILEDMDPESERDQGRATAICTAWFFLGMLFCVLLEWIVHKIHHKFSPPGVDGHGPEAVKVSVTETADRDVTTASRNGHSNGASSGKDMQAVHGTLISFFERADETVVSQARPPTLLGPSRPPRPLTW